MIIFIFYLNVCLELKISYDLQFLLKFVMIFICIVIKFEKFNYIKV